MEIHIFPSSILATEEETTGQVHIIKVCQCKAVYVCILPLLRTFPYHFHFTSSSNVHTYMKEEHMPGEILKTNQKVKLGKMWEESSYISSYRSQNQSTGKKKKKKKKKKKQLLQASQCSTMATKYLHYIHEHCKLFWTSILSPAQTTPFHLRHIPIH